MASMRKSRRMRSILAGAAAIATAVALAGCSTDAGEQGGGDGAPAQGGSVTIVSAGGMASWDPIVAVLPTIPGIGTDRMLAVYGALFYVDSQSIVTPLMAKSLSTDDFQSWTLEINEGIEFTDGTPYDAEAVKYNWERAAGEGSALTAIAGQIASLEADGLTLQIELDAPNPVFDRQVAEQLSYIASPTALEEQGADYTDPVGAGPFILDSWDPAVGEEMSRNPDYFLEGKPYLDELNFTVIADPAQRVTTVTQGGADIMNNYRFAILDVIDDPCCSSYGVASGGLRMFIFNNEVAPFDDVRAREAAALAIDPTEMTQTLTQDPSASGWSGLFPSTSNLYDKSFDLESGDIEGATALVDELKADGVDTSIKVLVASVPELVRAAELLQINLQEVGFDVQLEQIALGDWANAARVNKDFDITFYPGIYDLNNAPVSMTALFEGGENIASYSSDEMGEALEAAREATSATDLAAAFKPVQEIYREDIPFVVFGIDERLFFHGTGVAGFEAIGRGMLLTENLYRTDLSE